MPRPYKDIHEEKAALEVKETLATVRQILQLIKACAEKSLNFEDFPDLLDEAIAKVEEKMDQ